MNKQLEITRDDYLVGILRTNLAAAYLHLGNYVGGLLSNSSHERPTHTDHRNLPEIQASLIWALLSSKLSFAAASANLQRRSRPELISLVTIVRQGHKIAKEVFGDSELMLKFKNVLKSLLPQKAAVLKKKTFSSRSKRTAAERIVTFDLDQPQDTSTARLKVEAMQGHRRVPQINLFSPKTGVTIGEPKDEIAKLITPLSNFQNRGKLGVEAVQPKSKQVSAGKQDAQLVETPKNKTAQILDFLQSNRHLDQQQPKTPIISKRLDSGSLLTTPNKQSLGGFLPTASTLQQTARLNSNTPLYSNFISPDASRRKSSFLLHSLASKNTTKDMTAPLQITRCAQQTASNETNHNDTIGSKKLHKSKLTSLDDLSRVSLLADSKDLPHDLDRSKELTSQQLGRTGSSPVNLQNRQSLNTAKKKDSP